MFMLSIMSWLYWIICQTYNLKSSDNCTAMSVTVSTSPTYFCRHCNLTITILGHPSVILAISSFSHSKKANFFFFLLVENIFRAVYFATTGFLFFNCFLCICCNTNYAFYYRLKMELWRRQQS